MRERGWGSPSPWRGPARLCAHPAGPAGPCPGRNRAVLAGRPCRYITWGAARGRALVRSVGPGSVGVRRGADGGRGRGRAGARRRVSRVPPGGGGFGVPGVFASAERLRVPCRRATVAAVAAPGQSLVSRLLACCRRRGPEPVCITPAAGRAGEGPGGGGAAGLAAVG